MEKLPTGPEARNVRLWIVLTWIKLKLVLSSFSELSKYVWFAWKNCLTLPGQREYSEAMDVSLSSHRVLMTGAVMKKPSPDTIGGKFIEILQSVEPELWLPLTGFPLWDDPGEGKLHLAFEPEPSEELAEELVPYITKFLRKYAPKEIFLPSDFASYKVGSQKYNDGGLVKNDSEKPERSYDSGFLYQKFVTKPLQTREVWLPGKNTKNNNGWWFIIVDGLLRHVPYSALLKEPTQIHSELKGKLGKFNVLFDVSGYGIQYPRIYLRKGVEQIVKAYPGLEASDHVKICLKILEKVELQMPDGTFRYPSRGIGLGYYENLKTMIVMAIIDEFNPVSCYGDQAILPQSNRMMSMEGDHAIERLKHFGFLFTKPEKTFRVKKPMRGDLTVKWAGQYMNNSKLVEPRIVWSTIFGALGKMFHWERKAALRGVVLSEKYKHIWKRLSFQYERAFSFEFFKGESLLHPDNCGVNLIAQRRDGWTKAWKVEKLTEPRIRYKDGYFVNIPFSEAPKKGEARRFQMKRQRLYKRTREFDSAYINYVEPVIELNKKRNPQLTAFARSMPLWADIRNFLFENVTTGKIASGLRDEELLAAPLLKGTRTILSMRVQQEVTL